MRNINVEKIYENIKKIKGENEAKAFIFNMSNEIQSFNLRLKNIVDSLISKYSNKLSNETLIKLQVTSDLINSHNKKITNENDDFISQLFGKLDEVYYKDKQRKIVEVSITDKSINENNKVKDEIKTTSVIDTKDDLWIPTELLSTKENTIENEDNYNNSNFGFLEGIRLSSKSNKQIDDDLLEIVNRDDEDVYLLNGKEISDEEFMNALKLKI